MKQTIILTLITVILLTSCNQQDTTIFGHYYYRIDMGGSGITLNPDSTYHYSTGSCLSSKIDSGTFTYANGIMTLKSRLDNLVDTSNWGHGQIRNMTGTELLLENGKIYYNRDNGIFDTTYYWSKDGGGIQVDIGSGNFSITFYNENRQISEKGEFRNFKLYNGLEFIYNAIDSLERIKVVENGKAVRDSLIEQDKE